MLSHQVMLVPACGPNNPDAQDLNSLDGVAKTNPYLTEQCLRDLIVHEAEEWLETPFHHAAAVKGVNGGVDCLMLLVEVYSRVGIIDKPDVPYYPADWHMHRDLERYMMGVTEYAVEVDKPVRGGLALYKFGRCYSHGVIITEWPNFIHAYWNVGRVLRGSGELNPFQGREVRFFDPIQWS